MLKFGLFDRQALDATQWYSARCVLAGDAAHPTSPHLGQGANQALEDCYHLSEALPDLTKTAATSPEEEDRPRPRPLEDLEQIFASYARKRQPRTAALVRGARAAGARRVVTTGSRDCEVRNQVSDVKRSGCDANSLTLTLTPTFSTPTDSGLPCVTESGCRMEGLRRGCGEVR